MLKSCAWSRRRNFREADARCRELNAARDSFAPGFLLASVIAQHLNEHGRALQLAERAVAAAPGDSSTLLRLAQCLDGFRRRADALRVATAAEEAAGDNPRALASIGLFYSAADEHALSLAAYDRACRLAPDDALLLYSRAVLRKNLGQLDESEADYDRVLQLDPKHYESCTNRANLRTQTPERNHVAQLEAMLERGDADEAGEIQLCYALAKEYADLGRYEQSWTLLARGARLRRRQLTYDFAADLGVVDSMIEAWPEGPSKPAANAADDAPIFIVGLPRAGSTLVERILSSHSGVRAAGELRHFMLAFASAARANAGRRPAAAAGDRAFAASSISPRSATTTWRAAGRQPARRRGSSTRCRSITSIAA